jgi:hypothetical protein
MTFILGCHFSSLGVLRYVSIASQLKCIAMVIGGRNTAPIQTRAPQFPVANYGDTDGR